MLSAKDIMTTEVVTISGSVGVTEAVKIMKDRGLRALIVAPLSDSDPYGIVTVTDIIYKVAAFGRNSKQMRVREIMTKPCIVVDPDLKVEYIVWLLANARIRRVPVVKDKLLGIVSISDILTKTDFVKKPRQLYIEDLIYIS